MTTHKEMRIEDQLMVRGMIHRFYATDPNMGDITDEKITKTFEEYSRYPEKGTVFVIYEGDVAVGYSIVGYFWSNEAGGNIADIDELFVEEEYRGKGIGSAHINQLIQERPGDAVAVELGVIEGNDRAFELYKRLGFRVSTNKRLVYEL